MCKAVLAVQQYWDFTNIKKCYKYRKLYACTNCRSEDMKHENKKPEIVAQSYSRNVTWDVVRSPA
ncbi:hypothetical protein MIDIC_70050 [Alphaproteobacteria bacterium]